MAPRDKTPAAASRETVMLSLGDLSVIFKRPSPGQLAALRRAATLFQSSDKATVGRGGMLFLDVLDALVTDPIILNRIYEGMAKETIELAAYGQCAIDLVKHFAPEEAPTNGPVASTRRRATARTPKR